MSEEERLTRTEWFEEISKEGTYKGIPFSTFDELIDMFATEGYSLGNDLENIKRDFFNKVALRK